MAKTQGFVKTVSEKIKPNSLLKKTITLVPTQKKQWLIGILAFSTCGTIHLQQAKIAIAAKTYYVATNGSDSNLGTQTSPFATISYAISKVQAGDIVYVRTGTYYPTQTLWIGKNGTASAPIKFQPYPGEKVIVDGSNLPDNKDIFNIGGDYITIEGFEVRNGDRMGIAVWGGDRIKILNNTVHNLKSNGIFTGYSDLNQVTDILIQGNTVYNNSLRNNPPPPNVTSGWAEGINVSGVGSIRVINNKVYENYGEGIGFQGSGGLISQNTVYDNYSVNIYLDNATKATVERNLVYTTYKTAFYRFNQPANGIQIANETGTYQLDSNKIINNVVIGGGWGFYYGNYIKGGGMKNTLIANNTFYKGTIGLIRIDDDAHSNTKFANNIFYQTNNVKMTQFTASSALKFNNNLWYGGSAGPGAGTGDVTANPLLVNPGTNKASDYKPKSGSPVIEAGSTLTQVTNDYAGSSRPLGQKYDIGAYEF
ncbi:MAG TPA: hypothetical protein DEG17_20520 [Cyanobacteria bacterium UBA11149]|nr:hypothetical protein [Cyanobacteria bacterium UBA11367]HBE60535.1 hypothetical protein [Cyanobacteria bacterium UBA11366]HBK63531.1 hypothetical protein [Cyanobacteria bacterium UBA11166]HBR72573.1 hypothetical protein [Cyanobacteria bacterium UBA11159]HBS69264.1 hypothetical protein [Cyanobacteria bacterium UBA11153]HBW91180.1 hypothetical protein [Cyanobacteria bacterium UBA11149]HCA94766.1 hypothetical protein [Cyanobacteria bacterium UBA9226]